MKSLPAATASLQDALAWAQDAKAANGFAWDVAAQLGILAALVAGGAFDAANKQAIRTDPVGALGIYAAAAGVLFAAHAYIEFSLLMRAFCGQTGVKIKGTLPQFAKFFLASTRFAMESLLSWRNRHWLAIPGAAVLLFAFAPNVLYANIAGILLLTIYSALVCRNACRLSLAPLFFAKTGFCDAGKSATESWKASRGGALDLAIAYAIALSMIVGAWLLADRLVVGAIDESAPLTSAVAGIISTTAAAIGAAYAYASIAGQFIHGKTAGGNRQ